MLVGSCFRHWVVCLVCCCALLAQQPNAHGPERIYIENFAVKNEAGNLRHDVIVQLRRLNTITIVSNASDADAVLTGEGEIWVKGYRSLNPRSGRSPYNGTAVYSGFLSVELKDAKGSTLWSYMVTPDAESENISKDLAKNLEKQLAEAVQALAVPLPKSSPQSATKLTGAGATFPSPLYAKWFDNYHRANPSVDIAYDAVGSEDGIRRLLAGKTDFGASDSPEILHAIAPDVETKYLLFPSVVGAVVPIVNLPGLLEEVSLTPQALAGIYLGKIKKWNDPLLRQANRGIKLPDLDIVVIHRGDGSGTTYTWTDYLSQTSSEWKSQVGAGLDPSWPIGRAAAGNDGVAALVKELGGSIGYVEYIYAFKNHLNFARVQNRRGEFVTANLESLAAGTAGADVLDHDFKGSIVNGAATGAYPIVSFTWFIIPSHTEDQAKRSALADFLKWMLGPGQRQAAALGYLALPDKMISREESAISRIQ